MFVRLPTTIQNRLTALAQSTGRTKTSLVREAIVEHLDDLEDFYLAEKRLADNLPAIPLAVVMQRYGMEV